MEASILRLIQEYPEKEDYIKKQYKGIVELQSDIKRVVSNTVAAYRESNQVGLIDPLIKFNEHPFTIKMGSAIDMDLLWADWAK